MVAPTILRLQELAAIYPEKHLFSFFNENSELSESHTYVSFLDRVNVFACNLNSYGFETGSRVLLVFPPGLEMICALYACARAGLIGVPLPWPNKSKSDSLMMRLNHVIMDCNPEAIFTVSHISNLLSPENFKHLTWVYSDSIDFKKSDLDNTPHTDIFFLQYTSGSTSQPRGVRVTHENILANRALQVNHKNPIGVSWLPQYHDLGLIPYYIYTALSGGENYGFSPSSFIKRPARWLEMLSKYKATASSAPNFAFKVCLNKSIVSDELISKLDLSSLKMLTPAAEPIRPDIYRDFYNRFARTGLQPESFHVAYGLAENTITVASFGTRIISVNKKELSNGHVKTITESSSIIHSQELISCGIPLGSNKVCIVDPVQNRLASENQVGEIWVSGPSKCDGYWNKPELNKEVFNARIEDQHINDDWLRTGDLGFFNENDLFVCGRRKDLIIINGKNYYPQDIERNIESVCKSIRFGMVAAFSNDDSDETKLIVVAEIGKAFLPEKIDDIRSSVRFEFDLEIDEFYFVPPKSLQKTSSGKIMRFDAKTKLARGEFEILSSFFRKKSDDTYSSRVKFHENQPFAKLLQRHGLSGNENISLIEAGVDSLDLVILQHEIKELLTTHNHLDILDKIDTKILQQIKINDLFSMGNKLLSKDPAATFKIKEVISDLIREELTKEQRMMRRDSEFDLRAPQIACQKSSDEMKSVLLTGGSGFLGPFIIQSILNQTDAQIKVLSRRNKGEEYVLEQMQKSNLLDSETIAEFKSRVEVISGDLELPSLGLSKTAWKKLSNEVDTIFHNGAFVNYIFSYAHMKSANVNGTKELLRFAFEGNIKTFNYISTTFIYGWSNKKVLWESDNNDQMLDLDFGYSQSKWVSEQLVHKAAKCGLPTRIFRPSLISPSLKGEGNNIDILVRLIAFMVKYGVGVDCRNQLSILPAEISANNIVAICNTTDTLYGTYNVVKDDYINMVDITNILSKKLGRKFQLFTMKEFVAEIIKRCHIDDPIYPLIDFLINSVDHLIKMENKRYDNYQYRLARSLTNASIEDPSLEATIDGILTFMKNKKLM